MTKKTHHGLLQPDLIFSRITAITPAFLKEQGITALVLDIDNTLTTHDSQHLSDEVKAWLDAMQQAGFERIIVSNAKESRVKPFADRIGLAFEYRACKPLWFGFSRARRRLGLKRRECVVIGDQIFTDLLGAKWAGIRCVQVMPIELEVGKPFMMFKRRVERLLMKGMEDTV